MSRLQRIDNKQRKDSFADSYDYEIDEDYNYDEEENENEGSGQDNDGSYHRSGMTADNGSSDEEENEEEIELTEEDEEELRYYAKVYVKENPEECEEEIYNIKSVCDETKQGLLRMEMILGFVVLLEVIFLFSFHGQIPDSKSYVYIALPVSIVLVVTFMHFVDGYMKRKLTEALDGDGSIDGILATYIVEEYERKYGEVFDEYRFAT